MNTPINPIDAQRAAAQKFIQDTTQLWITASTQSDSADGLGIDGRISLIHSLTDASTKAYVAWLEALLQGGRHCAPAELGPPLPSEDITVAPRPYARNLEFVGPLVRVGLPKITIQPPAVGFDPPFLPAGLDKFRIVLRDYRLIGSNYFGTVRLTTAATATNPSPKDLVPDEVSVTVGL